VKKNVNSHFKKQQNTKKWWFPQENLVGSQAQEAQKEAQKRRKAAKAKAATAKPGSNGTDGTPWTPWSLVRNMGWSTLWLCQNSY